MISTLREVGRFHIDCTESVVPTLPRRLERVTRGSRSTEAMRQTASAVGVSPCTERKYDLPLLPVNELEWNLGRVARIQAGPNFAGEGARLTPRDYAKDDLRMTLNVVP